LIEIAANQWGWTLLETEALTDEELAALMARLLDRKMAESAAIRSAIPGGSGQGKVPESIALAQMGVAPIAAGSVSG